ncbi:hypothetical protein ebA4313 [Aromatoleum aromaticum EbN1]|uniref:Heparinase II N-terminal domain-containing protein n=2 Tax=Aromatoleum aromaticum TaxID=551760 RepID=Q5P296_AROAE|nr:hypothetical protein ebA4313 [Aromatoleum aromaticum EbN1]
MPTELTALLLGLNSALRNNLRPDTGLYDTFEQRPSPADHYGHTAAALALAAGLPEDWEHGKRALKAWLALDTRSLGHEPFNRLMLLLMQLILSDQERDRDRPLLEAGLKRCALRPRYPSNNWSLLAQTCRVIEAPADRRPIETQRLCILLDRWTTTKGAFIDFPENPGTGFSTPLAYHHKALFLAALACWFHNDAGLAHRARRLLDWMVHCWDPAGYAGGFGRSTHSLFGDGCLVAALILMGVEHDSEDDPIRAICRRLVSQSRPDGFLWLNPAGPESGNASWDGYMHLSVYNAWAAAIIGAARQMRRARPLPETLRGTRWIAARAGFFHDEEAGLIYLRSPDGLNALVSTRGQPPQSFSRTEADFRYSGGAILHLRLADGPPLIPPPVRVARTRLMETPALAGWTPLFRFGEEIIALDRFEGVQADLDDGDFTLRLEGFASAVFRAAPSGFLQRLIAILDWRALGGRLGRRAALTRRTSTLLAGRMTLQMRESAGTIVIRRHLEISGTGKPLTYLNPASRSRIATAGIATAVNHDCDCLSSKLDASLPQAYVCTQPPCCAEDGEHLPALELHLSSPARSR